MYYMKQKTPVETFKEIGFYITNNAELFAEMIMELGKQGIKFVTDDPGDFKYAIKKA